MMLTNRFTGRTSYDLPRQVEPQRPRQRQVWRDGRFSRASAVLLADLAALTISATFAVAVAGVQGPPVTDGFVRSPLSQDPLPAFLLASAGVFLFFAGHSHYSRRVPFWTEVRDLLAASLVALMFSGCVGYLLRQDQPRLLPVATWLAFPILAVVARTLVRRWLAATGRWQLRTVLVADPTSARQTMAALQSERQLGYEVVAVIEPRQFEDVPAGRQWPAVMRRHRADLLVLSYAGATAPGRGLVESLVRDRVPFAVMPHLLGLPVLGFDQTRFFSHDTVMFTFRNNLARPLSRFTKVVFDVAAAFVGVVVVAPVLLAVAVLVKLDGGPAMFGHSRIGSGGRPFRCLKFRSMVVDGDRALLARLLATRMPTRQRRNGQRNPQAAQRDPRVTWPSGASCGRNQPGRAAAAAQRAAAGDEPGGATPDRRRSRSRRYGEDIAYYYETRPGI